MSEARAQWQVGVDTGGTFTDFVLLHRDTGALHTFKVSSTPAEPAAAVRAGLERARAEHGVDPADITRFVFGTTVATNAVLERRGARTALVTTRGARDVLEIQRQWRHRLFDLELVKPEPLVPRAWRVECDERIDARGEVVRPLTAQEAARVAAEVAALEIESVAVCLLFSFLEPAHERRLGDALRAAMPGTDISLSADICPEFREYERSCTTAMNAYVAPAIHRVADALEALLAGCGCTAPLRIMQSNGGVMSVARMREYPASTLLSGPAGGVVGAVAAASAAGIGDVITMDMGGTSLDVSLVRGGEVELFAEGSLGGLPVKLPQVDVHTIGAGGGSIARLDRGAIRVGPESAGAIPGPACYGRGGSQATSTDCAVVAGYVDPLSFAGGGMLLDGDAARRALTDHLATPLGLTPEEAALAVIEVQVAQMVTGIRAVTVERGLDPREFALLCFGGAGALYAGRVAEELGVTRWMVPARAGVLSALGLLMSPARATRATTRLTAAASVDDAAIWAVFAELETRLEEDLALDGLAPQDIAMQRSCDMRYTGQAYEVEVPLDAEPGAPDVAAMLAARFHAEHERRYGTRSDADPVEMVGFRLLGQGPAGAGTPQTLPVHLGPVSPRGTRDLHCHRGVGAVPAAVYAREDMGAGAFVDGPCVIEEPDATIVIPPGHRACTDAHGHLLVTLQAPSP